MTSPGEAPPHPPALSLTLDDLVGRARAMIVPGRRRLLGITGAPAAGKSTVCAALAAALGEDAAVVPMDGFHLANEELLRLGRRDRKGAPDTFDAAGYAALLERLRRADEATVYAPLFNRSLEESIGSAIPVFARTPLVITEGNYLLLDDPDWRRARAAIDTVWYLELSDEVRVDRLVRRHEAHGRARDEAVAWAQQVDQPNADLIAATRVHADLIVQVRS